MPGSIIAPVLTAGVSAGASKLFGGKSKVSSPLGKLNAGGLSGSGGTITASPERLGMVSSLAATFPEQAGILKGLRESVAPGMSKLREARLAEVEGARSRAIGNLRDNLQRRRVLGSSFGQDAVVRGEAEFAKEAERVQAESFLQELELTSQLTEQEFTARRGEYQTHLDELNLEAEVGTQLASGATAQLGANARLKAELDAKSAAGAGKFFGQTFQPAIDKFANSFSAPAADPWAGLRMAA
jgi:hypothetical protein